MPTSSDFCLERHLEELNSSEQLVVALLSSRNFGTGLLFGFDLSCELTNNFIGLDIIFWDVVLTLVACFDNIKPSQWVEWSLYLVSSSYLLFSDCLNWQDYLRLNIISIARTLWMPSLRGRILILNATVENNSRISNKLQGAWYTLWHIMVYIMSSATLFATCLGWNNKTETLWKNK